MDASFSSIGYTYVPTNNIPPPRHHLSEKTCFCLMKCPSKAFQIFWGGGRLVGVIGYLGKRGGLKKSQKNGHLI